MKKLFYLSVFLTFFVGGEIHAQVTIGADRAADKDAILEMVSDKKGVLCPKVKLSSTASFSPLSAHVEGMLVYNTETIGDVIPGYYYNTGLKWVRLSEAVEPWNTANTTNKATLNTQDIYQMGKIGAGTNDPKVPLHVKGTSSGAFALQDGTEPGYGISSPDYSKIPARVLVARKNDGIAHWEEIAGIREPIVVTLPTSSSAVSFNRSELPTSGSELQKYLNFSITLPKGRWMISFGSAIGRTETNKTTMLGTGGSLWYKGYISTSSSSLSIPTNIMSGYTGKTGAGALSGGQRLGMLVGNIAVEVTLETQTFYFWGSVSYMGESASFTTTIPTNFNPVWENAFANDKYWEVWCYALPIN